MIALQACQDGTHTENQLSATTNYHFFLSVQMSLNEQLVLADTRPGSNHPGVKPQHLDLPNHYTSQSIVSPDPSGPQGRF